MTTDTKENIAQTVERITNGRDPVHVLTRDPVDDINVAIIPDGFRSVDMEPYLGRPRRHNITREMATLEGFAEYVAAHTIKNRTAIYVDHNAALAILNDIDRTEGLPVWGGHKATLALQYTPEWSAWQDASGQFQPQRQFVDFIQDRAGEIEAPPLADLVQELRNISADSTGKRRDQVGHMSQSSERSGSTVISNNLPEFLDLQLPILKCEPAELTHLQARLYVKLADDGVQFCAQLVNEQVVIDRRIREFVERLKKRIGQKVPVYF